MHKKYSETKSEDLGIKIGSKEEAAWTRIRDDVLLKIDENARVQLINKRILALAEEMIEKEKFKK